MDYLFARVMLWGRERGYRWGSLWCSNMIGHLPAPRAFSHPSGATPVTRGGPLDTGGSGGYRAEHGHGGPGGTGRSGMVGTDHRRAAPSIVASFALGALILAAAAPQEPAPPAGDDAAVAPVAPDLEDDRWTSEELDALVAPIALYPDALVAQILPASTYPLEVVKAARFLEKGGTEEQIDAQDWDPTIKALARYPDAIARLNEDLDWTQELGSAFLAQPEDLMESVQNMRRQASNAGSLQSTPQQTVVTQDNVITIEPADPQVIYVPQYNPQVVYVDDDDDEVAAGFVGGMIGFGVGVAVGSWLDMDCDWHGHGVYYGGGDVNIDVDRGDINIDRGDRTTIRDSDRTNVRDGDRAGREGKTWQRDPSRGRPPDRKPPGRAGASDKARGREARPAAPGARPAPARDAKKGPGAFYANERGSTAKKQADRGQASSGTGKREKASGTRRPPGPPSGASPSRSGRGGSSGAFKPSGGSKSRSAGSRGAGSRGGGGRGGGGGGRGGGRR